MNTVINLAIADDENSLRHALVVALESTGKFKVLIQAANGRELFEQISNSECLPDVCITDLLMPVMNGYGVLARIKKDYPEIKTLVFTKASDDSSIAKILRFGTNGYQCKNCKFVELVYSIETLYELGYGFSHHVYVNILKGYYDKWLLSQRQEECCKLLAKGYANKQIASEMGITESAVNQHRIALFRKLKIASRGQLALRAEALGLSDISSA